MVRSIIIFVTPRQPMAMPVGLMFAACKPKVKELLALCKTDENLLKSRVFSEFPLKNKNFQTKVRLFILNPAEPKISGLLKKRKKAHSTTRSCPPFYNGAGPSLFCRIHAMPFIGGQPLPHEFPFIRHAAKATCRTKPYTKRCIAQRV